MKFNKLLIVDTALKNTVGHHYEYAKSVSETALKNGMEVVVACHKDVEEAVRITLNVIPAFRMGMYQKAVNIKKMPILSNRLTGLVFILRFLSDWYKARLPNQVDSHTLVFLPTCTEVGALGIILWMKMRPAINCPKVVCLFRYDPRFTMKWIGRIARKLVQRHVLMLVTDSELLAEHYRTLALLDFYVVPIPHIPEVLKNYAFLSRNTNKNTISIAYLGPARLEKGFDVLVKSIPLLSEEIKNRKIKFVIQCNMFLYEPEMVEAIALLENFQTDYGYGIELIKQSVSTEDYYRLLLESDVIVIPYRSESYQARTSGILAEAFAAGKPVVVTENTWLSLQVEKYRSGIIFRDGDSEDLAHAIKRIIDEFDIWLEQARRVSEEWKSKHNAQRLLDVIFSYWNGRTIE